MPDEVIPPVDKKVEESKAPDLTAIFAKFDELNERINKLSEKPKEDEPKKTIKLTKGQDQAEAIKDERIKNLEQSIARSNIKASLVQALSKYNVHDMQDLLETLQGKFKYEDDVVYTGDRDKAVDPDAYLKKYFETKPYLLKPKEMSGSKDNGVASRLPSTQSALDSDNSNQKYLDEQNDLTMKLLSRKLR